MQVYPGVYHIEVPFSDRMVSVYLLRGERALLVDSGVADSPESAILPRLAQIGLGPRDIFGVVNTHAHTDHCGGNHQLKAANPSLHIMALEEERADVEDPVTAIHTLFDPYRQILGDAATDAGIQWNVQNLGPGTPVDCPLSNGSCLWLAEDWPIQVHHVPGHTTGHLSLFDPRHGAAFIGDAVGWKGTLTGDQFTSLPPYLDPDAYLETIRRVRSWHPECLCTSHYSVLRHSEIARFLDESEALFLQIDDIVRRVLSASATRPGLAQVVREVLDALGGDYLFDVCAASTVDAHVRRLGAKAQ
ncbi:MAG TPA: MBL fold metallo-hydrolase [Anaerolineae bacterium]|nr:MBL fold metallo-hydrolase [Anaerolineae bacterium]HPL29769.1 MBL fold metallo-hydrolase [Anaerolineae bacterium]